MHASKVPTRVDKADEIYYKVIPERIDENGNKEFCKEIFERAAHFKPVSNDEQMWTRMTFTLFSLMVSGSIFASYSPITFYGIFVYGIGSAIKPIFLYNTWCGFIYEVT